MPLSIPVGSPIDGEGPIRSADDVLGLWPETVRRAETAPVRDALAEGMADMFGAYQSASSYAAAQSDATRATDQYLEIHAAGVGVYPQEGETSDELRERLFATPDVVTPAAILTVTNTVLSRYTDAQAQLSESILDRWFVFDGAVDNVCHSYVTDGTGSVTPDYPRRRYNVRPQRSPTGALPFPDHVGRMFILRVPDIGAAVSRSTYIDDGTDNGTTPRGMFLSDGNVANTSGQSFLSTGLQTAQSAYQQIANSVGQIAGHGVRWVLWVDPKLT